jgi:chromosomal replication initiator protein
VFDAEVIAISLPRSPRQGDAAPKGADFIAGPENRLACAAAEWLLKRSERIYSPLVFHGPTGSGKTLLAQGLAESRENVVATTGADFVREVAAAIDTNTLTEFRDRYRSADFVVFEDMTDLVERRAAQRELIHLLDALELREVPVVVTSRMPPNEIADLPPALRSRLSGGLQVSLAPPGLAARVEIIRRLAAIREINIDATAMQLLAEKLDGTVPELQGALNELATNATGGETIDVDETRRYLARRRTRSQPSVAAITKVVAKYYGVKPAKLSSPARSQQVSLARGIAIYLGRQLTDQSLQSLGKHFGNRDHSTVLYSYRKLEKQLETDLELRTAISKLRSLLAA